MANDVLATLREAKRAGNLDQVAKELLTVDDDSGRLLSGVAAAMSPVAGDIRTPTGRGPSAGARGR
jgi:hypothetical protein